MKRATLALFLASSGLACTSSTSEGQFTPPPVAHASPPMPAVAAAQTPRCTLDPPNGVVVALRRGHARPVVGPNKVMVVHRVRGHGPLEEESEIAAHGAAFPLRTFATVIDHRFDGRYAPWANGERLGDAVVAERCGFLANDGRVECEIRTFDAPVARAPIVFSAGVEASGLGRFVAARHGDTFFALLAYGGTIVDEEVGVLRAFRFGNGPAVSVRLARLRRDVSLWDDAGLDLRVHPAADGTAAFDVGYSERNERTRYILTAAGTASDGARIDPPEAMRTTFDDPRSTSDATRHLRIAGASPRALVGMDESVATFSPSSVEHAGMTLLAWSEGTGNTTRIRVAAVDVAQAKLLMAPTDASTAGREAGFARIDAYGEHAVVAWDENDGRQWEVRAAEVRCAR